MQPPTPDDLARDAASDLAVCDAATAGPWRDDKGYRVCAPLPPDRESVCWSEELLLFDAKQYDGTGHDVALAAMSRTALPAWIRRAEHERQRAERAEKALASSHKPLLAESDLIEQYKEMVLNHRNNAIASRKRAERAEAEAARLKAAVTVLRELRATALAAMRDDKWSVLVLSNPGAEEAVAALLNAVKELP